MNRGLGMILLALIFKNSTSSCSDKESIDRERYQGEDKREMKMKSSLQKGSLISSALNILGKWGFFCFLPVTAVCYCLGCAQPCKECIKTGFHVLEKMRCHGQLEECRSCTRRCENECDCCETIHFQPQADRIVALDVLQQARGTT